MHNYETYIPLDNLNNFILKSNTGTWTNDDFILDKVIINFEDKKKLKYIGQSKLAIYNNILKKIIFNDKVNLHCLNNKDYLNAPKNTVYYIDENKLIIPNYFEGERFNIKFSANYLLSINMRIISIVIKYPIFFCRATFFYFYFLFLFFLSFIVSSGSSVFRKIL